MCDDDIRWQVEVQVRAGLSQHHNKPHVDRGAAAVLGDTSNNKQGRCRLLLSSVSTGGVNEILRKFRNDPSVEISTLV